MTGAANSDGLHRSQGEAKAGVPVSDPVLFHTVLRPHRSLSRRGFAVVMAGASAVALIIGLFYAVSGAWPVLGFYGLEIIALYAGFRWSYAQGRVTETLTMTADTLTVTRAAPGRQSQVWTFQPYWVRLETDGDEDGRVNRLSLVSHGDALEIGAFLGPDARASLADALGGALRQARA